MLSVGANELVAAAVTATTTKLLLVHRPPTKIGRERASRKKLAPNEEEDEVKEDIR